MIVLSGRAPHGACGLKCIINTAACNAGESGSSRSLWIEIDAKTIEKIGLMVGLLTEPVD